MVLIRDLVMHIFQSNSMLKNFVEEVYLIQLMTESAIQLIFDQRELVEISKWNNLCRSKTGFTVFSLFCIPIPFVLIFFG